MTICIQDGEDLLGAVLDKEIHVSEAGQMVQHWWGKLPGKFPALELDEYRIMPNHIHGVLTITGQPSVGVSRMVQWFKTMTTNYYIRSVETSNWPRFRFRLWQRGYFEHVIRDDCSLDQIRNYITTNPQFWGGGVIGKRRQGKK